SPRVDALEQPGAWRSTPWLLRTKAALPVGRLRVSSCPNSNGEAPTSFSEVHPRPTGANRVRNRFPTAERKLGSFLQALRIPFPRLGTGYAMTPNSCSRY